MTHFVFGRKFLCSAVLLIALNPPSSLSALGRFYNRACLSFMVVSTIYTSLICSFSACFFFFFLLRSWAGIPIPGLESLSYAQLFVTYIALPYTQFQAITQVHSSSYSKNHNQCIYLAGLKGIFSSLAASPSPESLLLHSYNLLLIRWELEIPHGAHETSKNWVKVTIACLETGSGLCAKTLLALYL